MDVNAQVTENTEAQPITEQNPEVGQNIEEKGAIPYARFKEVISQKNSLAGELNQIKAQLESMQASPQAQSQPGISTVEDLLAHVQSLVDTKLNEAYETKLKPVESYVTESRFSSGVERYFSDPAKAEVRQEMDAYTAMLDPQSQQFLKQQIMNGNYRMLDAVYHQIKAEKGQSAQTQAYANAQGMAQVAQQPQPFRTIRTGEPSINEIKQGALQTGNFKEFFKSIAPQNK
jgi:hypothetical protein